MKKLALVFSLLAAASANANSWKHLDFPSKAPYYHSVSTYDDKSDVQIEISCMKGFKDSRIVTMKGLSNDFDKASIKFFPSSKDKISKIIEGELSVSNDGVINVITGEESTDLVSYFKLLHSVNAEIKKTDETVVKYSFDLNGSSKFLNIFESKCQKLK